MTEQSSKVPTASEIWQKYQQGMDYGRLSGRFDNSEKCWRFFEGNQWAGIDDRGTPLPMYNIIKPVINYKKAKVAMNSKNITFSIEEKDPKGILDTVNRQMKEAWEFGKMDDACWEAVEQGFISGHSVIYFPTGEFFALDEKRLSRCNDRRVFSQILDGCQVFFGNEEERVLQNQPYIIIQERMLTNRVKKIAEENGIDHQKIANIMSDERNEADVTTGTDQEMKAAGGFSTSLLYFERYEGGIRFCRVVKDLVYQPFRDLGMDYYPMADFAVNRQKGKTRGIGEVLHMIPNQIELNKTLYRRSVAIKEAAFPKMVYNSALIENPDDLYAAGAKIAMNAGNSVSNINQMIDYLRPAPVSGDATNFMNELISITKELAGAGDAALGNVNPEQASGAAITAVQDQADIPMNREISAYGQMLEDIAIVWYHMIVAFNQTGYKTDAGHTASVNELKGLCPSVKIDISSTIPNTVTARINTLYALMESQLITFEEFMELAGSDSNIPIQRLKAMREEAAEEQQIAEVEAMEEQAAAIEAEMQDAAVSGMMESQNEDLSALMGG